MNFKKILICFFVFLIVVGVAIRVVAITKSFGAEETDFVKPAIAIINTGHPLFYLSEQQPNEMALWHPPMYIYSMAFIFKIFGVSETSARSINIVFSLLTTILIFLFSIKIFERKGKLIGIIASSFFLINYYVLSSSIMIDIDILSSFFVFAFIFCILMNYEWKRGVYAILAVFSFVFSLANRYPVAILVFFSIFLYFLIKKEARHYAKTLFFIGITGSLISLLIWIIYSTIIEPGTFFSFIIHNAKLGSEQFLSLRVYFFSFLLNISQFIRLVTLPATILIIVSFFYFLKRKEVEIRILIIYSFIILASFLAVPRPAFGYPRYFLSAFPGLAILISLLIIENIKKIKFDNKTLIIVLLGFVGSLILLLIFSPNPTFYQSNGLIMATNLPDFIINLACISPIFFALFARKNQRKALLILMLFAIFFAYCFYFDAQLVLNNSYTRAAGSYIKSHTSTGDLIVCPKAVGYYVERKFYVNDNNKPPINNLSWGYIKEYLQKIISNKQMNDEFFWENGFFGGINNPKPTQDVLNLAKYVVLYHKVNNTLPETQIGDFYIYRLNK